MAVLVEEVQQAKSGKSLRVKLGGTWYGAKLDSGLCESTGRTTHSARRRVVYFHGNIDPILYSKLQVQSLALYFFELVLVTDLVMSCQIKKDPLYYCEI